MQQAGQPPNLNMLLRNLNNNQGYQAPQQQSLLKQSTVKEAKASTREEQHRSSHYEDLNKRN